MAIEHADLARRLESFKDSKHTPGPWRWEINLSSKRLHLVGGLRPQYDLTIIDFDRWGMSNATMSLRDTAHDGMNLMHKLHERPDWIAPFKGREHHADWCQNVVHPDAALAAAAPELLEDLKAAVALIAQQAAELDRLRAVEPVAFIDPVELAAFNTHPFHIDTRLHKKPTGYANRPLYTAPPLSAAPTRDQIKHERVLAIAGPMAERFELHFGQSWTDPDWRQEASTWAAAWRAAKADTAPLSAAPAVEVTVHGELSPERARQTARSALGYAAAFDGKGTDWHSDDPWPHRSELAQALDWITDLGAMVLNLADRATPRQRSAEPPQAPEEPL